MRLATGMKSSTNSLRKVNEMKKRIVMFFAVAMATMCASAEPTVTDVVAKQLFPWNGLVDITCKVTGINGTGNRLYFAVAAVMVDSGNVRNLSHFWVVHDGTNSTDCAVHTNGSYRLIWDAKADLGQVTNDNMVVRVNLDAHRKVQLWEGGPFWADTNIGAENPEDYGYYFRWGDAVGYKRVNDAWVASDGSSSNFSFSRSPIWEKSIEDWGLEDFVVHDAAHVQWGGNWCMPTDEELRDLNSKCDWTWTMMNGVNGYVVKGKGSYASVGIFLPAAGSAYGTSLYDAGSYGDYWSSVTYTFNGCYYDDAWNLYFDSSGHYVDSYDYFVSGPGNPGRSVRPVQGFTESAAVVGQAGDSAPFMLDTMMMEPDGEGGWKMMLTNDIAQTVLLTDDLGMFELDLNGHSITGAIGSAGIQIVHGAGTGTHLRIVDLRQTGQARISGGSGAEDGIGGAGIEVATNAVSVHISVGVNVTVEGGHGTISSYDGRNGGVGVVGDVYENLGTISGGAGGVGGINWEDWTTFHDQIGGKGGVWMGITAATVVVVCLER